MAIGSFAGGGLGMGVAFTLEDRFSGAASDIQREMGKLDDATESSSKSITSSLNSIQLGFSSVIAGAAALAAVSLGLTAAGEAEQTQIAFATMLKSADAAKKLVSELRTFADVTPFEDSDIIQSGRMLTAYGVKAAEVVPTLTKLGNVAAGVGMSMKDLSEIYGKNLMQPKLTAVDMMQMAGRGIPIYKAMAEVMGVAVTQVGSLVTAGKVGVTELQKAFELMGSGQGQFSGLMDKQSTSFVGLKSTLSSYISRASESMGNVLLPVAKSVTEVLIKLFTAISSFVHSPFGQWIVKVTAALGAFLIVVGIGLVISGGLRFAILKLAMAFGEQTRATILATIAQQGFIAGLRAMAVAIWATFGPFIILAIIVAAFVGLLYGMYKAIENGNYVLAGFAVMVAFAFGPIYGIVAIVAGAFMLLKKSISEFSDKSASDLGKAGGIVGFLEKIGGLIAGVRAVFSSWNSELKTFELSKELEDKLAKVGMLDTVKNIGTWIARFSEAWIGFKEGLSSAWSGIKSIFNSIAEAFSPVIAKFESWGILISANTDSLDKWKKYGEYAAYALVGVLGILTVAFVSMAVSAIIAMLPTILVIAAIGLAVYGLIKLINWIKDDSSVVAGYLRALFSNIWDFVSSIAGVIWEVVKAIGTYLADIIDAFKNLFKTGDFISFFGSIIKAFSNLVDRLTGILVGILTGAWTRILNFFDSVIDRMFASLGSFVGKVVVMFRELPTTISNAFSGLYDSVSAWLSGAWEAVVEWFTDLVSSISLFFSLLPETLTSVVSGIWEGIKDFFSGGILGWFSSIGEKFLLVGEKLVDNIKQGISNKWEAFKQWWIDKFSIFTNAFNSEIAVNGNVSSSGDSQAVSSYGNNGDNYRDNLSQWNSGKWIMPEPSIVSTNSTSEKIVQPVFVLDGNVFSGVVTDNINLSMNRR